MSLSALNSQFDKAYKSARTSVERGEPLAARDALIVCMSVLREIYRTAPTERERIKTFELIRDFKQTSESLYEHGITAEVLAWFRIDGAGASRSRAASISEQEVGWAAKGFVENSASVVHISGDAGCCTYSGTGFIISEKGYLLTNHHVVYDHGEVLDKLTMKRYGSDELIPIRVIDADRKNDVALCAFDLRAGEPVCPVRRIADYTEVLPGSDVMLIGNALSMGLAPITGVVKFPHDERGDLVSTIPSNRGDSGGPLFNRKGECIGINKSSTVCAWDGSVRGDVIGIANATPMDKIEELLRKWCNKHDIIL